MQGIEIHFPITTKSLYAVECSRLRPPDRLPQPEDDGPAEGVEGREEEGDHGKEEGGPVNVALGGLAGLQEEIS